tara:strand:- start:199477 stop:200676 length:1200 start_codon:yes stop_codon:yes gene_type:complete
MIFIRYFISFSLLVSLFVSSFDTYAQTGEEIFKRDCASCHMITDARLIGPGLKGVTEKYEKEWLVKWITNSSEFIASGDERAIAIWEEYNKVAMPAFYYNDPEDYEKLLAYIENPPVEDVVADADTDGVTKAEDGMAASTQLMLAALALLILSWILISVKNSLKESLDEETFSARQSILLFFTKPVNKLFSFLFIAIIALKFFYDAMMGIGVTTNYQPKQPIAFSHKLHAGMQGIDCNYCHTSARTSKHSGIPSVNVCMNCHNAVAEGPSGKEEIQKIYDAVGWDPDKRQYIEGYPQKPIEWIRIHNLPDHVYFNHSQHVSVAGLECKDCHGPIEEMDEVYQYSELTMGWCIDCHRSSEVKMEDNEYYEEMHKKLKVKYEGEKITVDKIGGLECGKCHY